MSDSVRSHRRQPTRLPRPWDSPGKNTAVGCHFLLQCMKMKSESEATQSCPTLSDPMDCSLPGSSVHGIFQARVLEWGAIAFSEISWVKEFSAFSLCWKKAGVWAHWSLSLNVHPSYLEPGSSVFSHPEFSLAAPSGWFQWLTARRTWQFPWSASGVLSGLTGWRL